MNPLVTAAEMRALEAAAIAAGATERDLMARAGLGAAQEAWVMLGATPGAEVLVLCGPGHNGGDGLVAARALAEWGARVQVYLLRPRGAEDAEWAALAASGVPATVVADDPAFAHLERLLSGALLVVDALFGTGFDPRARAIEGSAAEVLLRLRAAREVDPPVQVLALDVPSGVDADTGAADPVAVPADRTATFGCAKVGLYAGPARGLAGEVITVDIGLPPAETAGLPTTDLAVSDVAALLPPRPADGHKGTFGTALIAAGSRRFPGAARLASEAAARSGAGLVTLAAPAAIQPLVAALPDVTHEPLPAGAPGETGNTGETVDAASARALLRALVRGRARALLVGPGLDLSADTEAFVAQVLAGLDAIAGLRAVVLDADALNALARLPGWEQRCALPRVLTPHVGEMARLAGIAVDDVERARLDVARAYATRTGSVVVLKGAGTIVAHPDGRARICPVATSALAHAGSGDVLAGLVVGLLAQGLDPFDAASAAVALHAECGRRAERTIGAASALASDLLRLLPEVRRAVDPEPPSRT